jgi:acetyltransferase
VARYIRQQDTRSAEFAIVLSDDWQGCGLGSVLLRNLVAAARENGIDCLDGAVLSENSPMIALAKKLGFSVHRDPRGAQVTLLAMKFVDEGDDRSTAS